MVAEKRKLRRRLQRSRNSNVKTNKKRIWRLINAKIPLWKATKSSNRPQVQIPLLKNDNTNRAKSNKQKVDTFTKHLRETFSSHDLWINTPNDVVEHLYDETVAVYSDNEVKLYINQLKL